MWLIRLIRALWNLAIRQQPDLFGTVLRAGTRLHFVAVFCILLFISHLLGNTPLVGTVDAVIRDAFVRRKAQSAPASHSLVITISQKDVASLPLKILSSLELESKIGRLLEAKPALLVLDLDTSPARFACGGLRKLVNDAPATVIVARSSQPELVHNSYIAKPKHLFGGEGEEPSNIGLALLEGGDVVRGFVRGAETTVGRRPTISWAAIVAACAMPPQEKVTGLREKACSLSRGKTLEKMSKEENEFEFSLDYGVPLLTWEEVTKIPDLKETLQGKVVFLGTDDDMVPTRFGARRGPAMHAAAMETELAGTSVPKLPEWGKLLAKIMIALLILVITERFQPWWALGVTLALAIFVAFSSFYALYSNWHQVDSMPFMIGIWMEQLFDSTDAQ